MQPPSRTANVLFAATVLAYFLAEAVLRRTIYYVPPSTDAAGREVLLRCLPDFLQQACRRSQAIADLEAQIEQRTDVGGRRGLLFTLSRQVSDTRRQALLWRIITEDPRSVAVAAAWAGVLPQLPGPERVTRYLEYLRRCDVRTAAEKLAVWQTGLGALGDVPADSRREYLQALAAARVVSASLADVYDEHWAERCRQGDVPGAARADELRRECRRLQRQEQAARTPGGGR